MVSQNVKQQVSSYLQGPRKKKKDYIVLALGQSLDPAFAAKIRQFAKVGTNGLSVADAKSVEDLGRQVIRNISLLLVDDEFADLDAILDTILSIKTKKRREQVPVMFLTRNPERLVRAYQAKLAAHQEIDDFVDYRAVEFSKISGRIRAAIETKNRRRSRRFAANIPVRMQFLDRKGEVSGEISDISLHGAYLKTNIEKPFRSGEQLRLSIPMGANFKLKEEEFLRVSAKIRRVGITGNNAAVSFEHLEDEMISILTQMVLGVATAELRKGK